MTLFSAFFPLDALYRACGDRLFNVFFIASFRLFHPGFFRFLIRSKDIRAGFYTAFASDAF